MILSFPFVQYVAHNLIFELKKVSIQLQNENGK